MIDLAINKELCPGCGYIIQMAYPYRVLVCALGHVFKMQDVRTLRELAEILPYTLAGERVLFRAAEIYQITDQYERERAISSVFPVALYFYDQPPSLKIDAQEGESWFVRR